MPERRHCGTPVALPLAALTGQVDLNGTWKGYRRDGAGSTARHAQWATPDFSLMSGQARRM